MEESSKLFSSIAENPNIPGHEKREMAMKVLNQVVPEFFKAVQLDCYPHETVDLIFGIQEHKNSETSLSQFEIGVLVYGTWQGLIINQIVEPGKVIEALIEGKLPSYFKEAALTFYNKKKGKMNNYLVNLIKRGFDNIIWDTVFHNSIKKMSSLKVSKQRRFEIKSDHITFAYGWDKCNGYFISVFDKRLEWKEGASDEVNSITVKIGVMDGGGSYFDLHTGSNGYGFEVSQATLAEYMRRYGAPESHVNSVKLGRDFS
jgi:hypothetical protein